MICCHILLFFVVIFIGILLILTIVSSLGFPPTPNSAAKSSYSSLTTSSQPVADGIIWKP